MYRGTKPLIYRSRARGCIMTAPTSYSRDSIETTGFSIHRATDRVSDASSPEQNRLHNRQSSLNDLLRVCMAWSPTYIPFATQLIAPTLLGLHGTNVLHLPKHVTGLNGTRSGLEVLKLTLTYLAGYWNLSTLLLGEFQFRMACGTTNFAFQIWRLVSIHDPLRLISIPSHVNTSRLTSPFCFPVTTLFNIVECS